MKMKSLMNLRRGSQQIWRQISQDASFPFPGLTMVKTHFFVGRNKLVRSPLTSFPTLYLSLWVKLVAKHNR